MRARRFGRWVGRAAVFAAVALGALAAGSAANADVTWERSRPTSSADHVVVTPPSAN